MDFSSNNGSRLLYWCVLPRQFLLPLTRSNLISGGLLPMIPYFAIHDVLHALFVSIGITVVTLFGFGFVKNFCVIKTKRAGFYGAAQTLLVGTIAAATSYGIVYGIDHSNKQF